MTDFEHAEISRRLALAIGWPEHKMYSEGDGSFYSINISDTRPTEAWRDFDYRDFAVIWPIAERFNAFPVKFDCDDRWHSSVWVDGQGLVEDWADTAALAVALAVIKAREGK